MRLTLRQVRWADQQRRDGWSAEVVAKPLGVREPTLNKTLYRYRRGLYQVRRAVKEKIGPIGKRMHRELRNMCMCILQEHGVEKPRLAELFGLSLRQVQTIKRAGKIDAAALVDKWERLVINLEKRVESLENDKADLWQRLDKCEERHREDGLEITRLQAEVTRLNTRVERLQAELEQQRGDV